MSRLETRVEELEAISGESAKRYAIVPPDFTGKLPRGVIGVCTGVPRHDDRPDRFRMMGISK